MRVLSFFGRQLTSVLGLILLVGLTFPSMRSIALAQDADDSDAEKSVSKDDTREAAKARRRTQQARALFQEGVALAEKAEWAAAARRFRRANELSPSPIVAYNAAVAERERGHLLTAQLILEQVERDQSSSDEILERVARELLSLEENIPKLYVVVNVEAAARFTVDGLDRPAAMRPDGRYEVPLDPGEHTLATQVKGSRGCKPITLRIEKGERREAAVDCQGQAPQEAGSESTFLGLAIVASGALMPLGYVAGALDQSDCQIAGSQCVADLGAGLLLGGAAIMAVAGGVIVSLDKGQSPLWRWTAMLLGAAAGVMGAGLGVAAFSQGTRCLEENASGMCVREAVPRAGRDLAGAFALAGGILTLGLSLTAFVVNAKNERVPVVTFGIDGRNAMLSVGGRF